jgi:hypothetical protein
VWKKGSINDTELQTPSVKKKANRLATNALPIPIDERGETCMAVLLAYIDVADYCVAWIATQRVISHQLAKVSNSIRIDSSNIRIAK